MPDPETLDILENLFREDAWTTVATVLRWGFLVVFARMAWLVWICPPGPAATKSAKRKVVITWLRGWGIVWGILLLALGARQATWQLLGRRSTEFVSFMQKYDRREFNPAHGVRPGRLQDRFGKDLAVSAMTDQGIRRVYPLGPFFAHTIGYNHPMYGMSGLESSARRDLMGYGLGGVEDLKALGLELVDRERSAEGPTVQTTLDAGLQRRAVKLLGDRKGAVVILEVETGEIRCLVSTPSFDPNRLRGKQFSQQRSDAPFLNRALAGQYPPGSVFKILVAASALDQGFSGRLDTPPKGFTTSPSTPPIRDHGYYTAQQKGKTWQGYGPLDLGTGLAKSSNVFFARLGVEVGGDALTSTLRSTGLTRSFSLGPEPEPTLTVAPLVGAVLSDDRPYGIAQTSIGQGTLLVNPMHIALLSAAVANEGVIPEPRLTPSSRPGSIGRLCTPESAETLKWMMYKVVQGGTGRGIRMKDLAVAGKTGTAQTGGDRPSHSWFTGFTPVSEPKWAFCVLVEEGGYGSAAALPLARALLLAAMERGEFAP